MSKFEHMSLSLLKLLQQLKFYLTEKSLKKAESQGTQRKNGLLQKIEGFLGVFLTGSID